MCTAEFHPIYWIRCFEFLGHELICNQYRQQLPSTEFHLTLYLNLIFSRLFRFRHFLFLSGEFIDSSSKMSRNVKKGIKRFIKIHYVIAFWSAILEPPFLIYLFINFQFRFVIKIFKNPQLQNIKYIISKERCTNMFQRDIKIPQIYKCSVA